jgi:hypothetical protein
MVRSQTVFGALLSLTSVSACAGSDDKTTLDELAQRDDVRAAPTFQSDVCRCRCDKTLCWRFTCDESCTRGDEYMLAVRHGPESGEGECLPETQGLKARLISDAGETIEPLEWSDICGQLEFTWRGLPSGVDLTRPQHVEISDPSATWTIVSPFAEVTATVVAPAAVASLPLGETATVNLGEAIVVELIPPVRVKSAHATLRSIASPGEAPQKLPVSIGEARLDVTIPPTTATGRFDLVIGVQTELDPEACQGPPVCHGRSVSASWRLDIQ